MLYFLPCSILSTHTTGVELSANQDHTRAVSQPTSEGLKPRVLPPARSRHRESAPASKGTSQERWPVAAASVDSHVAVHTDSFLRARWGALGADWGSG